MNFHFTSLKCIKWTNSEEDLGNRYKQPVKYTNSAYIFVTQLQFCR